jgi:uracil-DNA glycosylase
MKKNFEKNGILLLNMALIFTSKKESKFHLKKWTKFINKLLESLKNEKITLILFGKAAKEVEKFECSSNFRKRTFPHPYNLSFINDSEVHRLFKPMKLLYL